MSSMCRACVVYTEHTSATAGTWIAIGPIWDAYHLRYVDVDVYQLVPG